MDNSKTEIVLVVDKSGSMNSMRQTVISAINSFLAEQKQAEGTAAITLYTFNQEVQVMLPRCELKEAADLTPATYQPNGCTALLDAVGTAIDNTGKNLTAMAESERPGTVIIGIMTDGYENASSDYTWKQVADRIKHQREKYNWHFNFFGAGADTFDVAAKMNISRRESVQWDAADAEEVQCVMQSQSRRVRAARACSMGVATRDDFAVMECSMSEVMDSCRSNKKRKK